MSIYNDSNYYVYLYLRPDYTPYYVGKGKGNRIHHKHRKLPLPPKERRIIIQDNLTELQSFILERYYIKWFGRKDLSTGILRNLTDGGDGISGHIHSIESKQKMSLSRTGKKQTIQHKLNSSLSKKGKPKSEEHSKKISIALTGKPKSEEHRKKLSLVNTGKISPIKGIPKPKTECPHCGKLVDNTNMIRWHGDKCKMKPD